MNQIDPIVWEIDEKPAIQSVGKVNKAIDDYGARTARTNKEVSNSFEIVARKMEQQSLAVRSVGNSFENALKGAAAAARGATEFATAMFLGVKAISAQVTATSALEAAWNRIRAARIGVAAFTEGIGGAAVVGAEIAAVIAIEKIASATYARSKEIQSQALRAQQTGFTYEDRVGLDFSAQRAGRPTDYYDSAVKSAGGVAQLSKNSASWPTSGIRLFAPNWLSNANLVRTRRRFSKVLAIALGIISRAQHQWGIALDGSQSGQGRSVPARCR